MTGSPRPAAGPRLADLHDRLLRGEAVEQSFDGVCVSIEQPHPVLYLHCRTEDPADRSLVAGQSSLITTSESADETSCRAVLRDVAAAAVSALQERFGCAVVVELWTQPREVDDDEEEDVRLIAPGRRAPDRMMDVFQHSLARGSLNNRPWRVGLSVVDRVAGPGLPDLVESLPPETQMIALAVRPRWRGPRGGLHPQVLRDMRRDLGRALKEAAYDFGRRQARTEVLHYHVLGRHKVAERALQADRELCEVADRYSLLLGVTPVNVPAARAAFEESMGARAPEFHYRPLAIDTSRLKQRLYEIDFEAVEDPALHDVLTYKRQEIDREITLLDSRCGPRFLADSLGLFGGVDDELRELAFELLERLPQRQESRRSVLSAEALCARAEVELQWLRQRDPALQARAEVRPDAEGVLVERGHLLVGPDVTTGEDRVEALLQHEVGTHIVTHHNGGQQPLRQLQSGMAGYEKTQEGIAVLAEYLVGGLSPGRLRLIAGRVLAVDALVDGADFVEVVRLLQDAYGFSRRAAFTVTMRVFRGGGFTKDVIYLRGLAHVLQQLASGTRLNDMLVGKIALEDWPIVEELLWREIIRPARLLPRYLHDAAALRRLDHAARGLSVLQIAEEVT